AAMFSLFVVMFVAGSVFAQQGEGAQFQTKALEQNREQIRDNAQDPQGDLLRQRIQERIKNEDGLNDQEREQLRQHLRDCGELGLDDAVVGALIDEGEPLRSQIRNQKRILEMKREGLPIEPVMTKLQEGRRKGASDEVVEKVCARMEANVRTANRFLARAREDGVTPGDNEAEQRRTREMAMNMWRGLNEGDMEQLRERARLRLREGSCTTEDLAAAAGVASRYEEMGIGREQALRLAGAALQNGYSAGEIHQLRLMVLTAHMHGAPSDAVLDTLENELRNQHQLAQMFQQMWQHGWMGPADEHGGRGGHSPGDDMGGGGPGSHGGPGDDGQHRKGGGGQGGDGGKQ
ncbi:MAG: hypothetical protein P8181_10025, partial [bacterium]